MDASTSALNTDERKKYRPTMCPRDPRWGKPISNCPYDPEPHGHKLPDWHPVGKMVMMTLAEYKELEERAKSGKTNVKGGAKDMGEGGAGFGRELPRP